MKKVKTLVIHPEDKSTDFLCPIYANVPNKTVVRGGISKYEVIKLIEQHDRIMMMGHGSSSGLFSVGRFTYCGFNVIDETMAPLLLTKKDNVYIWCNADMFVKKFNLTGFFSGMFVSEVGEAHYMRIPKPTQQMVDDSNNIFSEIVSQNIKKKSGAMFKSVLRDYEVLADINPVASYNLKRLYLI